MLKLNASTADSLEDDRTYRRIRFVVAAIERGAKILGVSGNVMCDRLAASGLLKKYLFDGYEVLHTQSFGYAAETAVEALLEAEKAG